MAETSPDLKYRKPGESTTRHDEELFRLFIESLRDYAIFLLDAEGKILTWTLGGQQLKGFRAEEILGKDFAVFYRREDIRQGKPQQLLEEAAARGRAEDEGWRLRKDGSRFWAHVDITALRDGEGRLRGFGKIVSDTTNQKLAEGTLRNVNEKLDQRCHERTRQLAQTNRELQESLGLLRALAAHLQSVREDERTLVAREIHDELGQALTAMKMDLVWMMQRLAGAEKPLRAKAHDMLKLIDGTILSVRRIASTLRPGMLDDLGLSAAIQWQAQEFQARTGIECKLVMPPENVELDSGRSTAVFRIFQETLTNVARHAAATRVVVKLKITGKDLILEVVDNGRGFETGAITTSESIGLLGMRERALLLGGGFEIRSSPGKGTGVTVRVPLGRRKTKRGVRA